MMDSNVMSSMDSAMVSGTTMTSTSSMTSRSTASAAPSKDVAEDIESGIILDIKILEGGFRPVLRKRFMAEIECEV